MNEWRIATGCIVAFMVLILYMSKIKTRFVINVEKQLEENLGTYLWIWDWKVMKYQIVRFTIMMPLIALFMEDH